MTENYVEPVLQLLTLGETDLHADQDYLEMGFTREHIPELIRLVQDEILRSLPQKMVMRNRRPTPRSTPGAVGCRRSHSCFSGAAALSR